MIDFRGNDVRSVQYEIVIISHELPWIKRWDYDYWKWWRR